MVCIFSDTPSATFFNPTGNAKVTINILFEITDAGMGEQS